MLTVRSQLLLFRLERRPMGQNYWLAFITTVGGAILG
jgi:hypothetical protein